MIKTQIFPIQVVQAAWIGITDKAEPQKGKWHKWLSDIFTFIKNVIQLHF